MVQRENGKMGDMKQERRPFVPAKSTRQKQTRAGESRIDLL
jgi:hypothetical protein